jgi:adenosylmethionine-8-amino-7-oxononanoate aminotransferase
MIASERVIEPFLRPGVAFPHGYTFGGHPVAAAVSLANLDLMERERLNDHVLKNEAALGRRWASCSTCRSSATCAATATSGRSSW